MQNAECLYSTKEGLETAFQTAFQGSLTVSAYQPDRAHSSFCKPRLLLCNSPWEFQLTVELLREIMYSKQLISFIMFL